MDKQLNEKVKYDFNRSNYLEERKMMSQMIGYLGEQIYN